MTPRIGLLLPLAREVRWSDLLATLVDNDPGAAADLLGLGDVAGVVTVRREAGTSRDSRTDLLVLVDGRPRSVVEVKMLAGVGGDQLERYVDAFPGATGHVLVHPAGFPTTVDPDGPWTAVTWEAVLTRFAGSRDEWVAATADAALAHLAGVMPDVDAGTTWGPIPGGRDFVLELRARMAWVFGALRDVSGVSKALLPSSSGVSWVTRLDVATDRPDYWVIAEVEERLPNRAFPKTSSDDGLQPRGVGVKLCLLLHGIDSSLGYDWEHLGRLWTVMAGSDAEWVTRSARPKAAHDVDGWQRMVAAGTPKHVGFGFGDRQTRITGECMFGAKFELGPDLTVGEVAATLDGTVKMMRDMAAVPSR